ncbi:MAG TPA: ATP-binding protein [Ferruginibacter sp.]|nr:ATP-binding protein [Ferruginibacter sp.]
MIGRKEEAAILKGLLQSGESELVSILGRRRVGKTYLIREVYKDHIVFEFTGIQDGTRRQQLDSFAFSMQQYFGRKKTARSITGWLEAFEILIGLLSKRKSRKKPVVFIDELPWIAGKKSDFLKAFGFFWNSWAVKNNIVVAICGSAASWMIKQVINNKGGLHNRVTRQICLQPFKCNEAKLFLQHQGLQFTDDQVTELYMVFGGIPFYLKLIPKGCSVAQAVTKVCFAENAPLKNEFDNLYAALFANHYNHIAVIKACYAKWKGMSHYEIVKASGIPSGGTLTKVLEELEMAGFISSTAPFTNVKKEKLYRLTDEFSLFYLKFMVNKKNTDWVSVSHSQPFKLWQGYAFENFCFRHIQQIKNVLGIGAVITSQYAYNIKAGDNNNGSQLDLILDRNDRCINLCEIKYYEKPFSITPQYARVLEQRIKDFKWHSGTKKTVFLTFITKAGLKNTTPLVDNEITLDDFY